MLFRLPFHRINTVLYGIKFPSELNRLTRHYSAVSLLKEGLNKQKGWVPVWRDAAPKAEYDVVIIGGGGHGLATAYYLAKEFGMTNIAVLEKGWIGGGNTGRNTTVIRSNYFFPESAAFYDFSVKLYEGLSRDLNYNIMFSQRGIWSIAHDRHTVELLRRGTNAMLLNGVDAELHDGAEFRSSGPRHVFRLLPVCCRSAAASLATMRSPGDMRARQTREASTSFKTVK